MKPPPFRYARPGSVDEVVALLAMHGAAARVLAGGQTLMPLLVRRIERPCLLIDINRIAGLDLIETFPTRVRMGALVRQEQALRCAVVRRDVAGLAAALAWVANPVVRQRGTVVGNLVTNGPGAELPAVALALGAEFVVRDAKGESIVPAAALLGPGHEFAPEALVTHVLWPRRPSRAGFYEVARRDGHAPVVSSLVTLAGADCRVALSGVCRTGLSCPRMARLIAAQFPHPPATGELATALWEDLNAPVYADLHSSAAYRLEVAPVVSQRATRLMAQAAAA
ncbi:MAG TPA: FAD binding domain-containing protein [Steroidobacteraceae bacterium]|nr:FAD binding domain-containing protein [Steroidobacteraceae bacterium]